MNLRAVHQKLLKDPELRKAYEAIDLPFEIGKAVTDMRIATGITQVELARRIGTQQESISRLERGNKLPSLSFLRTITEALGYEIEVKFKPRPTSLPEYEEAEAENMKTRKKDSYGNPTLDIVIKKDGYAGGKGVLVRPSAKEAAEFIDLIDNDFPFWDPSEKNVKAWLKKRYPALHKLGIL